MSEIFRRRNLPHWDVAGAPFFVTTCLEGGIPASEMLDLTNYRARLDSRARPQGRTEQDWACDKWKSAFGRAERWLDEAAAIRHLADPRLARIVADALYFFAGQRYDLLAFVVMPSHYHWVFRPLEQWVEKRKGRRTPREVIIHSANLFTARQCNAIRGKGGTFWQHESYDHWIRDADELERIVRYVENNPVKAGLACSAEEWPYSSAHDSAQTGREFGEPLCRQVSNWPETAG